MSYPRSTDSYATKEHNRRYSISHTASSTGQWGQPAPYNWSQFDPATAYPPDFPINAPQIPAMNSGPMNYTQIEPYAMQRSNTPAPYSSARYHPEPALPPHMNYNQAVPPHLPQRSRTPAAYPPTRYQTPALPPSIGYQAGSAHRHTHSHSYSGPPPPATAPTQIQIPEASTQDTVNGVKRCANCRTTATPVWRRDPQTSNPLCNACGLYLIQRQQHRPQTLIDIDNEEPNAADSEGEYAGPECTNCGTRRTSTWRRSKSGQQLCNACGVYERTNGKPRPLALRNDKIRPREKQRKS